MTQWCAINNIGYKDLFRLKKRLNQDNHLNIQQ